ncbi:MAG TPA: hypothetical protein VLC91_04280, partial [Spongiibacteraceae bacterium]|nr:hypothetical protein [Spongiibacteraceae bacterium]
CFNHRRGNPVLWPSRYFSRMLQLTGDRGARELLMECSEAVRSVQFDEPAVLQDIDTCDALTDNGVIRHRMSRPARSAPL